MRIVVLCVFVCMSLCYSFSQNSQKSFKQLLESTKANDNLIVEGYYVDNSSFMVTRSSDALIKENKRYPVYEYKFHKTLYNKDFDGMTEVPIAISREMQGKKNPRILVLNKKRTTSDQLVIEEFATIGISIKGDRAEYVDASEGIAYVVPLVDLTEYLFGGGVMPQIEESPISSN